MLPQIVCMIVSMLTAVLICLLSSTTLTLAVIVNVHARCVMCEMKRQMLKSQVR